MTDTASDLERYADQIGDDWTITWGDVPVRPGIYPVRRTRRQRFVSSLRWRVSEAIIETRGEIFWIMNRLSWLNDRLDLIAYRIRWGKE